MNTDQPLAQVLIEVLSDHCSADSSSPFPMQCKCTWSRSHLQTNHVKLPSSSPPSPEDQQRFRERRDESLSRNRKLGLTRITWYMSAPD
ncbi:hypothetical protein RSAG8_05713, partial [Rhizoctonia solani AG-8 WAC10335]